MINEADKIIEEAKKIALSSEEKSFMKERILEHIQKTPVPSKWYSSKVLQSWFVFNPLYAIPIVLVLLVMAGGGTGIVAQKSLPGDALYPFKIHLNENIESMAAVTTEADAEVELMQATRRLEEVEDLKVQGNLSPQAVSEVKDNFSNKVNSLNKNLEKIEKRGNTRASSEINQKFKNKITEHYKAFLEVSKNSTTTSPFIEIFKSRINDWKNEESLKDRDEVSTTTPKTKRGDDLRVNVELR